ncbi:MAG: hypothetical protein FWG69_04680 [Oscillospiraceae bacterium]|nr:hypothetical protein [Oscillospiraceae bacterium]
MMLFNSKKIIAIFAVAALTASSVIVSYARRADSKVDFCYNPCPSCVAQISGSIKDTQNKRTFVVATGIRADDSVGGEIDPPAKADPTPFTAAQLAIIEDELVRLVNNLRDTANKFDLSENFILTTSAGIRAKEAGMGYTDVRPDGKVWSSVLKENAYTGYSMAAESTAGISVIKMNGYTPGELKDFAAKLLNVFKSDLDYYPNITNGKFTCIGVGVSAADDGHMIKITAAQIFSDRK